MPAKSRKTSKKPDALLVEGLSVSYGDLVAVDQVSFSVPEGKVAAIIGPNGSGKTTLMRAILGLVEPDDGEALIFGKHLHEIRDRIGYVPQRFSFDRGYPITVGEFLELARRGDCPRSRFASKLKEVGLGKDIMAKRLGALSGGQLQRVLIAQAILNEPDILFLDEPSAGIDVGGEAAFYKLIGHLNDKHGTTVLLISHDINAISSLVDQVICINRKMLCAGPPGKALSAKTVSELYGHDVREMTHEHHH